MPAARVVFTPDDRAEIATAVEESLRTGALTLGPHTRAFEAEFAARHDAPFAVAVSSGTAALEILLRIHDVAGGEVVVPTNTFFATAMTVVRAGATPVFADMSATTLAVTAATVEAAMSERTRAVIAVHIGGLIPPDIDEVRDLCERRGVLLIEDAAHAHGSALGGRPAGTWGPASFSFYPTKVITSGEGGMIVTADEHIRDEAAVYRDQGKASFQGNLHEREGYAWRMSELHAAVGRVHLRRLDDFLAVRRRAAARYDELLAGASGLELLPVPAGAQSNYYKYVALLAPGLDRQLVKKEVRERYGVSLSGEVYEVPLHRQPVFERFATERLAVAEDVCARQICLPVHSDMTEAEMEHVATAVRATVTDLHGNGGGVLR